MLSAYDVLTLIAALLAAFLLLADVRDELLRACRPTLLRALENAGVLTRDEYERRARIAAGGVSVPPLTLKQEQMKGIRAAGAFARGVVAEQQAVGAWGNGHSAAATSAPRLAVQTLGGTTGSSSVTPSPDLVTGSSAVSKPIISPRSARSASAVSPSNAALAAQSAAQSFAIPSSSSQQATDAAVGHRPSPLESDRGQLTAGALQAQMDTSAVAEAAVAGGRPRLSKIDQRGQQSRSRSRSRKVLHSSASAGAPLTPVESPSSQQPRMLISILQPTPKDMSTTPQVNTSLSGTPVAADQSGVPSQPPSARPQPDGVVLTTDGGAMSAAAAAAEQLNLRLLEQHQQAVLAAAAAAPEPSLSDRRSQTGANSQNAYMHWLKQQQQQQASAAAAAAVLSPTSSSSAGSITAVAAAGVAALGVPLIAGHPLTSLSLSVSSDCGVSVEEYFTSLGEKIAWRRGGIWDSDFIYSLSVGQEMMKFGAWGKPHIRKVRFMLARGNNALGTKPKVVLDWGSDSIPLEEVTQVLKGKTAGVLQKRYAKDEVLAPEHCCFTVVTARRTLDLAVPSTRTQRMQQKRDLLVFGLAEITGTRVTEDGHPVASHGNPQALHAPHPLRDEGGTGGAGSVPIAFKKIAEACMIVPATETAPSGGVAPFVHGGVLGNGIMAAAAGVAGAGAVSYNSAGGGGSAQAYYGAMSHAPNNNREYSMSTQLPLYQAPGGGSSSIPGTPASVSYTHMRNMTSASPPLPTSLRAGQPVPIPRATPGAATPNANAAAITGYTLQQQIQMQTVQLQQLHARQMAQQQQLQQQQQQQTQQQQTQQPQHHLISSHSSPAQVSSPHEYSGTSITLPPPSFPAAPVQGAVGGSEIHQLDHNGVPQHVAAR